MSPLTGIFDHGPIPASRRLQFCRFGYSICTRLQPFLERTVQHITILPNRVFDKFSLTVLLRAEKCKIYYKILTLPACFVRHFVCLIHPLSTMALRVNSCAPAATYAMLIEAEKVSFKSREFTCNYGSIKARRKAPGQVSRSRYEPWSCDARYFSIWRVLQYCFESTVPLASQNGQQKAI